MPLSPDVRETVRMYLVTSMAAYLRELAKRYFDDPTTDEAKELVDAAWAQALVDSRSDIHAAGAAHDDERDDPEGSVGFDKNAYMADFMAKKRSRETFAATVESLRRHSDGLPMLKGTARQQFMQETAQEWKRRLDGTLAQAREDAGDARMPKWRQDEIRQHFWESIQQELEAEAFAIMSRGNERDA